MFNLPTRFVCDLPSNLPILPPSARFVAPGAAHRLPGARNPPGRGAELRRSAAASALVSVGNGRARRAAAGGEGGNANRTFFWAGWDGRTDGRADEMNEQMWTIEKWLNKMS